MSKAKYIGLILFFGIFFSARAQETDTLTELDQVNVIKSYEPVLISSNKVPFAPDMPKIAKEKPEPRPYTFADIKGKIEYKPEEIRPVKYTPKKADKQPFFYLKAGFGNYLTPLLNVTVTNPNQKKGRVGLTSDFILSKAKHHQQYFDFNARGFGEFFIKKSVSVGGDIRFGADRYNYYGFPDSLDYGADTIRNLFKRFGGSVFLRNINNNDNYDFRAEVGAGYVSNSIGHKETGIDVKLNAFYGFKKHIYLGGNLWVNNLHFNGDTSAYNRFSVSAIPFGKVHFKIWQLEGGPNIIITNRNFYIFPQLKNQLQIFKDYLVMYNEWNSQLKVNGLDATTRENPFVVDENYMNQIDETRTFAGLRGTFSGFGYDLRFSQWVSHNNLQFIGFENYLRFNGFADPAGMYQFKNNYVFKVFAWNPHFGISYARGNQFGGRFSFDYFWYYKNPAEELSYMPSIKSDFEFFYNWKDKLNITLNITALGKMHGVESDITTVIRPIKGVVDINLSASYFINKHIGFFLDLNNLAHQKYPRYYRYPTYGFQPIGGVKISY